MSIDLPAFADPVHGAQSCFRAVLDAMSRPGTIGNAGLTPPPPLAPATAAFLLTLVDGDTALGLAPEFQPAADWIAFHCGATITTGLAAFVLATELPDLALLAQGSDDAPQDSATVILQVASLAGPARYRLTGPGIETHAILAIDGLPPDFIARWTLNRALFPRGVDLILCAGDRLACLPRGIAVSEA